MDALRNKRNPETSLLRILRLYSHRILKNEIFQELDPKNPRPKFRYDLVPSLTKAGQC